MIMALQRVYCTRRYHKKSHMEDVIKCFCKNQDCKNICDIADGHFNSNSIGKFNLTTNTMEILGDGLRVVMLTMQGNSLASIILFVPGGDFDWRMD